MVQFTKPAIVAVLLVAPAIAAPLSQVPEAEEQFTRSFEETELNAREPAFKVRGVRKAGRYAGKALNHAGNIASVASLGSMFAGRDLDESELEAREPAFKVKGVRKAGRYAGKALNHAGNIASVASLGSMFAGRDIDESELEAREPAFKVKGLRKAGRYAGKALNHAGNIGTIASLGSMFAGRDFDEIDARNFDEGSELDARANGRGFALGGAAFAAMLAARPLGESLATIIKRPAKPTFKRSFEDDEEMFARDFDEQLELLEREYEDALEQRSPAIQAQSLLKLGTFLGKSSRWLIPAGGAAGVGIGLAGKLRSREFDGDFEMYERDFDMGGSLDEMD